MIHLLIAAQIIGTAVVIDGDTIKVNGENHRLMAISAPEKHHMGGPEAKRFLEWFAGGRTVRCDIQYTDRYGRHVSICKYRDYDLGEMMIRAGHAQPWCKFDGEIYNSAAEAAGARKCPEK